MSGTVSDTRAIGEPTLSDRRPADQQVDVRGTAERSGAAVAVATMPVGGWSTTGRLLRLRRGNEDDDDGHDQRREEGGRPAILVGAPQAAEAQSCVPQSCSSPLGIELSLSGVVPGAGARSELRAT